MMTKDTRQLEKIHVYTGKLLRSPWPRNSKKKINLSIKPYNDDVHVCMCVCVGVGV